MIKVRIEVWEDGNPFNSQDMVSNLTDKINYNKQVEYLVELLNNKQNETI